MRELGTRRQMLQAACLGGLVASGLGSTGCSLKRGQQYEAAAEETWHESDFTKGSDFYRELVRCATLAPSSHNTQPWTFKVQPGAISVLPDYSRRCPQVDPDDHHLFVSLGCAAENLSIAASAAGLHGRVSFQDGCRMEFEPAVRESTALFHAIAHRQCSRCEYDGKQMGTAELKLLEEAGTSDSVNVLLLTDRRKFEPLLEFVAQGNRAQMGNGAWMQELEHWIRFNETEALDSRDGLYSRTSGNSETSRFLGSLYLRVAMTAASQTKTDVRNIRSSAGIAVFTSEANSPRNWFEAGRAYERFALQATALGIRTAFINQPVEVLNLRPQFASWLGIAGRRPDLVVRFGHGPAMPRSLRRPLTQVIA